jgi:hypothetical protein
MSELITIWTGSAFTCSSSNNEIYLTNSSAADETCNDEMITGQIIKREGNNYTSQLNVTLSSDLTGKIECVSNNGSQTVEISNTSIDICMWVHIRSYTSLSLKECICNYHAI